MNNSQSRRGYTEDDPARGLGASQRVVLRTLRRLRTAEGAPRPWWDDDETGLQGSRAETIRVLDTLIRRGLVERTERFENARYALTEAGKTCDIP